MATEQLILDALKNVYLPDGPPQDIVALGLVKNLKFMGGVLAFTLELPPASGAQARRERLEADCRQALVSVRGVTDVAIHVALKTENHESGGPAGIKHIIAVGSGKGGVGKSTVAVNLAIALAETGARVGLVDADIYGPSIPMMMGAMQTKPAVVNNKLVPLERHGVKLMSMGFLLPNAEDPVVWRGPMLVGALRQFFSDVQWGELDYMLVDLPPGTGDIPLSLVQTMPLSGAAIVITPQPVAASIGIKTLRMFEQTHVPILGLIENMSHFTCEHCGHDTDIFDRGGGRRTAEAEQVPFLGEIPLDPTIRQSGDRGNPVFSAAPKGPQAEAFRAVARALVAQLDARAAAPATP